MIRFEHTEVLGWEHAIRGMRNPMNSWEKSDSELKLSCDDERVLIVNGERGYYDIPHYAIGKNDLSLVLKLAKAGSEHAKYRRMIVVYCDITAPLYWWKEFETYKVGTVTNSCSTMHTIHKKEFECSDFSCEYVSDEIDDDSWVEDDYAFGFGNGPVHVSRPIDILEKTIKSLNKNRALYLASKDKRYWWNMIQLLPSSYNQRRTVMLNYEVLANIYRQREGHKLDEWQDFRRWIERLPYSEIITLKGASDNEG